MMSLAENPASMILLQSVLVEQSKQAGAHPYPYALIRAHETAVQTCAKPSILLRESIRSIATKIRICGVIWIMMPEPRSSG